eukprot:3588091-Amphidinium_carterae.1
MSASSTGAAEACSGTGGEVARGSAGVVEVAAGGVGMDAGGAGGGGTMFAGRAGVCAGGAGGGCLASCRSCAKLTSTFWFRRLRGSCSQVLLLCSTSRALA